MEYLPPLTASIPVAALLCLATSRDSHSGPSSTTCNPDMQCLILLPQYGSSNLSLYFNLLPLKSQAYTEVFNLFRKASSYIEYSMDGMYRHTFSLTACLRSCSPIFVRMLHHILARGRSYLEATVVDHDLDICNRAV